MANTLTAEITAANKLKSEPVSTHIDLERLRFDDDPGGVFADDCLSNYTMHEGLLAIPVMGPVDTTPVIVRVHAAYTSRQSSFMYARNKVPPLVPSPGDTKTGYIYLGGNIKVNAPKQDAQGYLTYSVTGGYNFVGTNDLRGKGNGKIMFDAHGYLSLVDLLGAVNINPFPPDNPDDNDVWQTPYLDLNSLTSARILG